MNLPGQPITDALVHYGDGVPAAVDFAYNNGLPIYINFLTGDIYVMRDGAIMQVVRNAAPHTVTEATYSVAATDTSIIANKAGTVTLTLPSASAYPGRSLNVRTIQAQTVVSDASNVVPLAGGSAGTAILAATAGKWAKLQSDGSNWQIMEAN